MPESLRKVLKTDKCRNEDALFPIICLQVNVMQTAREKQKWQNSKNS